MTKGFNYAFIPLALLMLPLLEGTALAEQKTLSGTVVYDRSVALPAAALLEVRLLDISIPGSPARVVTHYTLPAEGDPIPFTMSFDDGLILYGHRYALDARIGSSSTLWFSSSENAEVAPLSQHYPVNITVAMIARPSAQANPSASSSKSETPTGNDTSGGDSEVGADIDN